MIIELTISGMNCQHCVRAVDQALRGVSGVARVEVDLETGHARVEGDVNADDLIRAVAAVDYHAVIMTGSGSTVVPPHKP